MSVGHTWRQNLVDAVVWVFETVVCAAIFSIGARLFFGGIIEDGGWRTVYIGVSVWLLGAVCATIDVHHRRRKRREPAFRSPAPTPDQSPASSDHPGD